ncbi:MAG: 30S ribosomal protein S6 [Aestuariivirgaceae bacterium]
MAFYEHIFLVRQDASNTQVEALTQQFKTVIEERGGKVAKTEYWGVKPLTYRMKKNRKAHYTLMNIDAPSAAIDEVERQQSINEDVLRFLTVRVDELEEGASAMMRSRGRDDRDGEGGGGRFGDRGGRFGDRPPRDFGDRGDRPPRDFGDRGPRPPRPPREASSGNGGEGRS